jgi:hypothetical protein
VATFQRDQLRLQHEGDFVFGVSRDFIRHCAVPMLVLPGDDAFHPATTARAIARLAPHATLIERWRPSRSDTRRALRSCGNFFVCRRGDLGVPDLPIAARLRVLDC